MKAALLQLNSSDDPTDNLNTVSEYFDEAVAGGADFILTPEVTNCLSTSRTRQKEVLSHQKDDPVLAGLQAKAKAAHKWCLIGSLALKTDDPDGRFANRSFLITPDGEIAAWYDKVHMFDVTVSETETYRESDGYRPGDRVALADTPFANVGLTVCYDIRFPALYRILAQAGAEIITVPSAFSPVTGAAHWETLLRARAIETGSIVLAPAQTGAHTMTRGRARSTYGHSLAIGPWGEILADSCTEPGVIYVDLPLDAVKEARSRIPSWRHNVPFKGPK